MSNVFGIIVSGRLVQTEFTAVSETQFVTTIPEAESINYLVVFLTGAAALPAGAAAAVYFSWPDPAAPPHWQLLGHISNSKPSAIFKISNLKKLHELSGESQFSGALGQQQICVNAQLGIAIEPEENVQLMAASVAGQQQESYVSFAQKMLEHLVNYVASYAAPADQLAAAAAAGAPAPAPAPGAAYVPLSALHSWYQTFERRLQQNPNFWKN